MQSEQIEAMRMEVGRFMSKGGFVQPPMQPPPKPSSVGSLPPL